MNNDEKVSISNYFYVLYVCGFDPIYATYKSVFKHRRTYLQKPDQKFLVSLKF